MSEGFSPLAGQLTACLRRLHPEAPESVLQLARRACEALEEGHVCVELSSQEMTTAQAASELVGAPGDYKPLVLDGALLYLARYWHYEASLAHNLKQRAGFRDDVDLSLLRRDLDGLFPHNSQGPDKQKSAAAAAVLRQLCVISGGPGTGKTSTVIRILAALQSQHGGSLRIGLAAPTGKAAARMQEAIRGAKQRLDWDKAVQDAIPENAVTLHRLLGVRPDSVYFRHHAAKLLPYDVLVVDEASMIDLALMAKLLDALPPACRLILLGDKDQLSSVEAGSVFGDICRGGEYSDAFLGLLAQAGAPPGPSAQTGSASDFSPPSLADSLLLLHHSHRFAAGGGIGELARMFNDGQAEAAFTLLSQEADDIVWRQGRFAMLKADLLRRMEQGYAGYFSAVRRGDALAALAAFNGFRVLTAHREGECGAENLSRLLEERIKQRLNLHYRMVWYPGRAVMITRNDYGLRLFNGDIGIALEREGQPRVYFEDADGRLRDLAPGRLPEHQPVYAMTVHKSQGSEFDEVLLLLPEQASPVLNRPLVYTAVTRAKRRVELWGQPEILAHALAAMPLRASGLRARLLE